jgi:hypothetical protein
MSEQIADLAEVETEQQNLEPTTQDDASLTADESGDNQPEKITFSPEQQRLVQDIAAKKAFEVREQKRANEELRRQLEQLQAAQPVEQAPSIPTMPDPYSDNYEQEIAERDKAILAKAQYDARAEFQAQQAQLQARESQRLEQEKLNKAVQDYSGRANKLGIEQADLAAAGQIVAAYGINDHVTQHILSDENGPLITKYLSANPQAMESLQTLPPINAGIFLETQIKPEAIKLKPKTSSAPDPIETLNGAGVNADANNYPHVGGGTFE